MFSESIIYSQIFASFLCNKEYTMFVVKHCAVTQLNSIFDKYKSNVIHSASQLTRILRYDLS